jgi:hypothetical protein
LKEAVHIFDYSRIGFEYLKSIGFAVRVSYLPPYFDKSLESIEKADDQHIDVLFYPYDMGGRRLDDHYRQDVLRLPYRVCGLCGHL